MAGFIWKAAGEAPAEIKVNFGQTNGLGWFTLSALSANGGSTDLKRTDGQDADGDALYRVTPNDDLMFKLQVLCASAKPSPADIYLRVSQGGATLECVDSKGVTLNAAAGGGFGEVKIGSVDVAKAFVGNFEIWE